LLTAAFPIFEDAEELDLAGPWEALALARDYGEQEVTLLTIAAGFDPVRMRGGLRVVPDHSFASAPPVDLIVVPGGPGARDESIAAPVAAWIVERRETPVIASVCTGAFVLAQAGLLDGKSATTHYSRLDLLRERYPKVHVVRGMRIVDQGSLLTAAGVTAGIDLGLHLVGRYFGKNLENRVADVLEYPPDRALG
jgi:transcriptional regulator GlxA family with amidase domain